MTAGGRLTSTETHNVMNAAISSHRSRWAARCLDELRSDLAKASMFQASSLRSCCDRRCRAPCTFNKSAGRYDQASPKHSSSTMPAVFSGMGFRTRPMSGRWKAGRRRARARAHRSPTRDNANTAAPSIHRPPCTAGMRDRARQAEGTRRHRGRARRDRCADRAVVRHGARRRKSSDGPGATVCGSKDSNGPADINGAGYITACLSRRTSKPAVKLNNTEAILPQVDITIRDILCPKSSNSPSPMDR